MRGVDSGWKSQLRWGDCTEVVKASLGCWGPCPQAQRKFYETFAIVRHCLGLTQHSEDTVR